MTSRLELGRGREGRRVFRGWLLVFFATTCVGIVDSAVGIARAAGALAANAAAAGTLPPLGATPPALIVRIALLGASLYGLYLFARGDERTPAWWGWVQVAFALYGLSFVVARAYRSMVVDGTPLLTALSWSVGLASWSGFAVTFAWLGYWMRSQRVRRTFGANAFARAGHPRCIFPADPHRPAEP